MFAALALYRWEQFGQYPSGLDGGNWLAIGRNMTGDDVHSPNGGIYPPIIPVLLHIASFAVAPYVAVKLMAVASLIAVVAAVLVVAYRTVGWWAAALAAMLVAFARPITEPMAFGGYPQNLAVAAGLLALWSLACLLLQPNRRHLGATAAFAVITALSHHMYFLVAIGTAAVLVVLWLATVRPPVPVVLHRARFVALPLVAALAAFLPTYVPLLLAGYEPPLNPASVTLSDSVEYGFRDVVPLWGALWLLAAITLAARLVRRSEPSPLVLAVAALFFTASAAFVISGEARLLAGVAVSAPLAVAMLGADLAVRLRSVTASAALAAAPASLLVALLPSLDAVVEEDIAYYRMLDSHYLDAVEWSNANPPDGAIAIASDRRDWPVGWWWRGLSDAPVLVGSNARWLAFEDEREEARLVATLLRTLDGPAAAALAREHGIGRVVVYREEWIGWQWWLRDAPSDISLVYSNETFAILDFAPVP